ncbi:MAG: tetratricopeptide repeat protein [Saprospiraceae bacterium]
MEHNPKEHNAIMSIVCEYEAMNQRGDVGFLDEQKFLQLIEYYEQESMLEKALEVIEHALEQYSFSAEFLLRKARLLLNSQQFDDALYALDEADIFAPSDIQVELLRCKIYCQQGDFIRAQMIVERLKVFAELEDLAEVLLYESYLYESSKDFELMFESLKRVLMVDPLHEEALERIWQATELTRKYEESINFHKKLIDRQPYSSLAWYNLGQGYACIGEYEQAIDAYEYAFIVNEKFDQAYKDCAELCFQIGRYDKALKHYQEALNEFGADSELLAYAGDCCLQLSRLREARQYFHKAIRIDPYSDEAYYNLGISFSREGKWAQALNAFFKAIDIDDRIEDYHAAVADTYFQLGDLEKTEHYYRRAIDNGPELDDIWVKFIRFYLDRDQAEMAMDVLDEAEAYTVSTELLYLRAACHFLLGERKEGLEYLSEALMEDCTMHECIFQLVPNLMADEEVKSMIKYYSCETNG